MRVCKIRKLAKATGDLAETDRMDADRLVRFAEAGRPETSTLPDEEALFLGKILDRRQQLIGMLVAKDNYFLAIAFKLVKRRV